MSESAPVTEDDVSARKQRDNRRLRAVALKHSTILLSAITLWGAADYWAMGSGLALAQAISLLNAIFAGTVIAYLFHEWGHFGGARMAGAVSPVLKEPRSFFMFNFRDDLNTRGQFLSMSAGGSVANWGLVIALFILLPMQTWSQALLFATTFAIAVSVSVFEFPIMNRVMYGSDPAETIRNRQQESGNLPRNVGIAAGAAIWLFVI